MFYLEDRRDIYRFAALLLVGLLEEELEHLDDGVHDDLDGLGQVLEGLFEGLVDGVDLLVDPLEKQSDLLDRPLLVTLATLHGLEHGQPGPVGHGLGLPVEGSALCLDALNH